MGNYRFRLSDMMPNAWFYKLKDMSRSKTAHNTKKRLPSCSSSTTTYSHQKQQPFHHSQSRNSYYYTPRVDHSYNSPKIPKSSDTHFPAADPPRKSSKRSRTKRKTIYKPSPKHYSCSSTATLYSACTDHHKPESTQVQDHFFHSPPPDTTSPDQLDHHESPSTESTQSLNELTSWSCSSCSCRVSSSATDIILDMNDKSSSSHTKKVDNFEGFDSIPEVDLPPILTRPPKPNNFPQAAPKLSKKSSPKLEEKEICNSFPIKMVKENDTTKTTQPRKSVSYSTGMKLRSNSPRIELSKKGVGHGHTGNGRKSLKSSQRKSFSKSCAIVKSSFDPQKDFRESMMEMIIENNIRASKDLEELLACYLTLNSNEYHDLIVKAFEQIWFSLPSF